MKESYKNICKVESSALFWNYYENKQLIFFLFLLINNGWTAFFSYEMDYPKLLLFSGFNIGIFSVSFIYYGYVY